MSVHWHDDECGWCPCDEPPFADRLAEASRRAAEAKFGKIFPPSGGVPEPTKEPK